MTLTDRVGSWYRLTQAILLQRCPACREGRVFRGAVAMNERCPVCGHVFQEDEGFFLGAMYVSYPLSTLVLIAFYLLFGALFPGLGDTALILLSVPPFLLFVPAVFRYSRVIWMHFISSTR
jgi:hypothetical protein